MKATLFHLTEDRIKRTEKGFKTAGTAGEKA